MELISKQKFKNIVGDKDLKFKKVFGFTFSDPNYYKSGYRSNIYLLDKLNNIAIIYNLALELLLIPETFTYDLDYLEKLNNEKLTVDDWDIKLQDEEVGSFCKNELERPFIYFNNILAEVDKDKNISPGKYKITEMGYKWYDIELYRQDHPYYNKHMYTIGLELLRPTHLSDEALEEIDLLYQVIYIKYFIK